MVVDFSQINYDEPILLILKNATEQPLGILGYAKNRSLDLHYSSISTLSFELPAQVDGIDVPFYDDVEGMRIVEVPGIGQFIVNNPQEEGDGVHREKIVEAYSLEHEFSRKNITLSESTYRFYDENNDDNSLMTWVMELMPAWSIGNIPTTIKNKYRTFSVENVNLYDLLTGTVQETYGCIFEFDTLERRVNVRDISAEPDMRAVWLSYKNLAKQLTITEDTENIFTRLDVNGADDVNIRDVNPDGTNKIVNLDYYMTTKNFSQALIDKYYAWKELYNNNKESYYNLSIRYTLGLMQKVTEQANLADLKGEVLNLDNQRAVTIQAISQGLQVQADLDEINEEMEAAQDAVDAKQAEIDDIDTELTAIMADITAIKNQCNFRGYFTDAEWLQIDRYIKDGDVTESTFVADTTGAYMDEGSGASVDDIEIRFEDGFVSSVFDAVGREIVSAGGGTITAGDFLEASVVSLTAMKEPVSGKVTLSAFLSYGTLNNEEFPSGCITFTGESSDWSVTESEMDGGECSFTLTGSFYFTYDTNEYRRRSVAWDLYEYGETTLEGLAYPSYTFSVDSANFLALEEFVAFKNALRLGQMIYLETKEDHVVNPILTGATLNFDGRPELTLEFGDKYSSNNPAQKLVDLLGQAVSMGKNVDAGKYTYGAFVDSGAATGIKTRMTSALDVTKNQIINTSGQAVSWDASGLHLRKWTNAQQTAYDDEQIWLSNNMIAMTDDGWATAKMAIGKFHDANAGDCWGIVAPMVMGTLLAGEQLIIESQKKDGGTAVFKMDGDGCRLYNTDLTISRTVNDITTKISINPDFGIAIGDEDLYTVDAQTGVKTLQTSHAKFWADDQGNLHLRGALVATSLHIMDGNQEKTFFEVTNEYVLASIADNFIYLKEDGIEMSGETIEMTGGSITIESNNHSIVMDSEGITFDGANIAMTGGNISLSSSTASLVLNDGGITVATVDDGAETNVVQITTSGLFTVDAVNESSYIRFGGSDSNPNFMLGLGGDIIAQNGDFASLHTAEGELVLTPSGYLAPQIVVSKTKPSGNNILWFEPSSVSTVDYTWSGSGVSVSTIITFTRSSALSALGGNEVAYGIKFGVYNYKGSKISGTITVYIDSTGQSDWVQIASQRYSYIDVGSTLKMDTLKNPVTQTFNVTTRTSVRVRVDYNASGCTARFQNNSTFTLRCSNSSTATEQACNVVYLS